MSEEPIEQQPDQEDLEVRNRLERLDHPSEKNEIVSKHGSSVRVELPERAVTFLFDAIFENSQGITAEVHIVSETAGRVHWGRLGLASSSAVEQLSKKLVRKYPLENVADWRDILDRVFYVAVQAHRHTEPAVQLEPSTATETEEDIYAIKPILPKGHTGFIYAEGGTGKSYLSLFLAVAHSTGKELPGGLSVSDPGPVLILDWESEKGEAERRLGSICRGLGIERPAIFYRKMARYLTAESDAITRDIIKHKPKLLIMDSWQPACGSDNADPSGRVVATFNTIRSFNLSCLVLAHQSKNDAQQTESRKIYGSIFTWNLARSIWELTSQSEEGSDTLSIGLFHRKTNIGKIRPPIGLQICFDSGAVNLYGSDIAKEYEILKRASIPYQVIEILKRGQNTVVEIAQTIGKNTGSVQRAINRLEDKKKVIQIKPAVGKECAVWGLLQ